MRILIGFVHFLRNPAGLLFILLAAGMIWMLRHLFSASPVKRLGEQACVAEALALGAELELPVPQMLELAACACGRTYRALLQKQARSVGDRLSQALGHEPLLPRPWLWVIDQAESRGELAATLHVCSARLLDEQIRLTRTYRTALGQIGLIVIGTGVAMVCLGTMLSITDLVHAIGDAW